MEFKTAISKMTEDDLIIHGKKHSSMIGTWPFHKVIFFLLAGREPSEQEETLFDAMLSLSIDHGMGTASSMATRFVQSTGNPLNAAVASGVLALGDYHGGAIEAAMRLLLELEEREIAPDELVEEALKAKRLLPGFGHKLYKKQDPRAKQLVLLCTKLGYDAHHLANAIEIEYAIEEQKGKRLVLNIDGAIAALLLEMGFSPEMGKGFFIIARTPGLVAHAVEERQREKPVRRIPEEQITYDGK